MCAHCAKHLADQLDRTGMAFFGGTSSRALRACNLKALVTAQSGRHDAEPVNSMRNKKSEIRQNYNVKTSVLERNFIRNAAG